MRGVYDVFNPTVVKMWNEILNVISTLVSGTDEETGAEISVYIGKGPVAKRSGGTVDDRFAPIKEGYKKYNPT